MALVVSVYWGIIIKEIATREVDWVRVVFGAPLLGWFVVVLASRIRRRIATRKSVVGKDFRQTPRTRVKK
jgi:hypothetical protein